MNDLKHYGILGMKWGVRRTPEQLGRKAEQDMYKKAGTYNSKGKYSTSGRDVANMTDDQLRVLVNRINMEQRYMDVMNQRRPESAAMKLGKEVGKTLLMGTVVATVGAVGKRELVTGANLGISAVKSGISAAMKRRMTGG